jgi:hypothetical protein
MVVIGPGHKGPPRLKCSKCAWRGSEETATMTTRRVYDNQGRVEEVGGFVCPECGTQLDRFRGRKDPTSIL